MAKQTVMVESSIWQHYETASSKHNILFDTVNNRLTTEWAEDGERRGHREGWDKLCKTNLNNYAATSEIDARSDLQFLRKVRTAIYSNQLEVSRWTDSTHMVPRNYPSTQYKADLNAILTMENTIFQKNADNAGLTDYYKGLIKQDLARIQVIRLQQIEILQGQINVLERQVKDLFTFFKGDKAESIEGLKTIVRILQSSVLPSGHIIEQVLKTYKSLKPGATNSIDRALASIKALESWNEHFFSLLSADVENGTLERLGLELKFHQAPEVRADSVARMQ